MIAVIATSVSLAEAAQDTTPGDADASARALEVLFETPYLSGIAVPSTLTYRFRRVAGGATAFEDQVTMELVEDQGEGRRKVAFEFLSGRERMPFAPKEKVQGNPLIMMFLQRDVILMGRELEGNFHYFRVRILDALRHKVKSQAVTLDFFGVPTEMTHLTIEPYLGDRERDRLASQERKRYEFTLSPEVPGGVFRIRSVIPGESGAGAAIEETMTFAGVAP